MKEINDYYKHYYSKVFNLVQKWILKNRSKYISFDTKGYGEFTVSKNEKFLNLKIWDSYFSHDKNIQENERMLIELKNFLERE